jgi:hypothetical protein
MCIGVRTTVTQAHDLGEVTLVVNSLEELDLGHPRATGARQPSLPERGVTATGEPRW